MDAHQFGQYSNFVFNDIVRLMEGAGVTLTITLTSLFIGTVIGTILGIIRCSKYKAISVLPLVVIEPLRNSPLVVQLFLVYFGLPYAAGIMLDQYSASIITLSLNTAAFFAVLIHNSIIAIPRAQWEAGYALGHTGLSTSKNIIAQQVFRLLIPQAITLYISQLQCSSVVALISMPDITRTGQMLSTRTMQPFLIWGLVFLFYYVISFPLARLASYLERRVSFNH